MSAEPTAEQVFEWLVRNAGWSITDSDDYVQDVLDARAALVQAQADEPCVCGTAKVCTSPVRPPASGGVAGPSAPMERVSRPGRRIGRPMSLVPVHSLDHARNAKILHKLRAVIVDLSHQADVLAEAGDLHSLAGGLDELRDLRRDLTDLERHVEQHVAALMERDVVNLDDTVVLERRRGNKRTKWDWDSLLRELGVHRWVDRESGEFVADTLTEVVSLTASVSPRAGALRDRGIDPDEFSESQPGRVSVRVSTREENEQ